ncbi:hypothetical protein [Methylocystis parvus]|uniref:Uncharacterized protein n=1 Tax=Methylocystis parvus TaxID=134 RepID=A0A6B8LV68_9HYPH|nr:hypothetical protein [Methylocystis parvus]QGM96267.1 hypothetical protein F7D14_01390 [Methylocystis parvus]WBJ99897.1 hypothetical protein MMG94_18235 [Methylocystis parvus OBBP]
MNMRFVKILALSATVLTSAAAGSVSSAEAHTYYRTHCWRQAVHHGHHHWRYAYARPVRYVYTRPAVYGYAQPAVYGYSAPACGCGANDVYGYGGYGGDGLFGAGYGGGGLFGLGLGLF